VLGGIALTVLFLGAVLLGDELRHQRHGHVVARRDDGRRQNGVVKFGLSIRALARQAMRTTELVRTEIFGSVQGDQRAAAKALELVHAALLPQRLNHLIERGLQMRRMNRVEHRPDVSVRRNFRHAEQCMAIGGLASFFERALVGQERLRLRENHETADRPMSVIVYVASSPFRLPGKAPQAAFNPSKSSCRISIQA